MQKKQVTFYMAFTRFMVFKKKYPNVISAFLRRCIYRALENPQFFQDVYFNTSDDEE